MATFEEAYQEYGRALREHDVTDQRYGWDEYRNYVEGIQEAQQELQGTLTDTWRRYAEATQDEEGRQAAGVGRSYVECMSETQEAQLGAKQAFDECARSYRTAMSDRWHESMSARQEAFGAYVAAIQEAWAALDPTEITPATLASVARSLLGAASVGAMHASAAAAPPARPSGKAEAGEAEADED